MKRNWGQLAYGVATRLPGVTSLRDRLYSLTDPGTVSARYCYTVWLRHLMALHAHTGAGIPARVLELGPGNSLGVGLACLLSGAEEYVALDRVPRARASAVVLDELVRLFRRRAPVPGIAEFPAVKPLASSLAFPRHLVTDDVLEASLAPARIEALRAAVAGGEGPLTYVAPWPGDSAPPIAGGYDLVLSQAVLEHVGDIDATYAALAGALRPGGFMSHQIDYKHHGLAVHWNGHWAYGRRAWAVLEGRRHYTINREPHSAHLAAMRAAGMTIVHEQRWLDERGLAQAQLAPEFHGLSETDVRCTGAHVIARRG